MSVVVYACNLSMSSAISPYVTDPINPVVGSLPLEVEVCHTPDRSVDDHIRLAAWANPKGAHGKSVVSRL